MLQATCFHLFHSPEVALTFILGMNTASFSAAAGIGDSSSCWASENVLSPLPLCYAAWSLPLGNSSSWQQRSSKTSQFLQQIKMKQLIFNGSILNVKIVAEVQMSSGWTSCCYQRTVSLARNIFLILGISNFCHCLLSLFVRTGILLHTTSKV